MKKLLTLILIAVMTMMFSVIANADGIMYGDVTADKAIDAADALAVLKHAAKIETLGEDVLPASDVTADGNIDATDALDILKYAAKIIDSFKAADQDDATPEPLEEFEGTVYIMGDSIAADHHAESSNYERPLYGWGVVFGDYFADELGYSAVRHNYAISSESTSSYLTTQNYNRLVEKVEEGDYVFVAFGHNDHTPGEIRGEDRTNPLGSKDVEETFQWYLKTKYIDMLLEKGATPIVLTPVCRATFDANGKFIEDQVHLDYGKAIVDLVSEYQEEGKKVYLIDTQTYTYNLYSGLSKEEVMSYHGLIGDSGNAWNFDSTHYCEKGARMLAEFIVQSIKESDMEIAKYIISEEEPNATATPTPKPKITPIPTEPPVDIPEGVWPTQIPLPVVEADPANFVEGASVELVSLNGATEENGIYTFTDDNATNRTGITFKNPFAGRKDLAESRQEALAGQSLEMPDLARLKYDPTVTYPSPVWKKGVSISFWAKYDWESEHYSADDPILVLHRSKRGTKDFTVSLLLDGTVRFEEGEDAHNSFRGNGAVCGNYNEWNYYTITMANDWICVYVNGQECVYQNCSFSKSAIGLFNGGYMTKYNVPWVMSDENLNNDIRGYYKSQLSGEGNVVGLELSRIDNGVFETASCWGGGTLLMDCLTYEDAELVIGGCTTFKVNGSMGKSEYSLKSGTQVADVEAYYVELTPEQVAANYAAAAEEFLK